jgi:hypothetical protein
MYSVRISAKEPVEIKNRKNDFLSIVLICEKQVASVPFSSPRPAILAFMI